MKGSLAQKQPAVPERKSSKNIFRRLRDAHRLHKKSREQLRGLKVSWPDHDRSAVPEIVLDLEKVDNNAATVLIQEKRRALRERLLRAKISAEEFSKKESRLDDKRENVARQLLQIERARYQAQAAKPSLARQFDEAPGIAQSLCQCIFTDAVASYKRTGAEQSRMKLQAIFQYDLRQPVEDGEEAGIWDILTGRYRDHTVMVAAHIIPHKLHEELIDFMCGEGSASRKNKWDNCLLLDRKIEQYWDQGRVAIIPVNALENPLRNFQFKIIDANPKFRKNLIPELGIKIGDLDGKTLEFRNDYRPKARFLYLKYIVGLLKLRNLKEFRGNNYYDIRTGHPWMTTGRYLRRSFLLPLARYMGDANEEEIKRIMAGLPADDRGDHLKQNFSEGPIVANMMMGMIRTDVRDFQEAAVAHPEWRLHMTDPRTLVGENEDEEEEYGKQFDLGPPAYEPEKDVVVSDEELSEWDFHEEE